MLPVRITPALWAIFGIAALGGLYWFIDAVGDIRVANVHAQYAKAADLTNADVAAFTDEDEKVAAVAEAMRGRALAAARAVAGDKHPASKEQAAALNQIR